MKYYALFFILLSGCAHHPEYKPANPQNTKSSYSPEITAQEYGKEHRCVNKPSVAIVSNRSAEKYETIGAFDIVAPDYIYDQPCDAILQAFSFCKATPRSIDNCIAGILFSNGLESSSGLRSASLSSEKKLEESANSRSKASAEIKVAESQLESPKKQAVIIREANSKEKEVLFRVVRESLKDPYSAQFYEAKIVNNSYACVGVNAKNAFGGYVGKKYTVLAKESNSWFSLLTMDSLYMCISAVSGL